MEKDFRQSEQPASMASGVNEGFSDNHSSADSPRVPAPVPDGGAFGGESGEAPGSTGRKDTFGDEALDVSVREFEAAGTLTNAVASFGSTASHSPSTVSAAAATTTQDAAMRVPEMCRS